MHCIKQAVKRKSNYKPTTAEYMRHLEYLEIQEQLKADAVRRQKELEE